MTIAKFETLADMKAAVKASGSHFFDPFYVNMLHSKIESGLIHGSFFITSEYRDHTTPPRYTARYWVEPVNRDANRTIGGEQAYASIEEAREAILEFQVDARLAREVTSILSTFGVTADTDDKGYPIFRLADGRSIRGEAFGRGTVANRSGVRLYEAVERPEGYANTHEIVMGDFTRNYDFGEYVRTFIIGMIERTPAGSGE